MGSFRTYAKLSEVLQQEFLAPWITVDLSKKTRDGELLHLFQDQSLPVKPPDSAELFPALPTSSLGANLFRGPLVGMCPREYWVASTKGICSDWLFIG